MENLVNKNEVLAENQSISESQSEPIEIAISRDLTEFIPEDARADNRDISADIKGYEEQGLFAPTVGMAQMVNRFNGKIYAYISVDEKGNRTVRFLQAYDDGTYSNEFCISQSDLLCVAMQNRCPSANTEFIRESKKSQRKILKEYLDKCDGREVYQIGDIVMALAEVLKSLPVISDRQEISGPQLYSDVLSVLKARCSSVFNNSRRGGYIMLGDYELEIIAAELDIPERTLLAMLKKNRLLYLTESCQGYQAKVPVYKDKEGKAVFQWCYCLLDMEYYSRKLDPSKTGTAEELNPPLGDEIHF